MTIPTVPTPVDARSTDNLEATDATILTEDHESVDVGPFTSPLGFDYYKRLTGSDLVAWVDACRRVLTEIEAVVLDARQDKADAERSTCPWCSTLIEADEDFCGSATCARQMDAERRVEALL